MNFKDKHKVILYISVAENKIFLTIYVISKYIFQYSHIFYMKISQIIKLWLFRKKSYFDLNFWERRVHCWPSARLCAFVLIMLYLNCNDTCVVISPSFSGFSHVIVHSLSQWYTRLMRENNCKLCIRKLLICSITD